MAGKTNKRKTAGKPAPKSASKSPLQAKGLGEGAREKILKVAAKLFADRGLDGVSVRDISREAEVNVSLVSYYFGGKEGLYVTIIEEHARHFHRTLVEMLNHFRELPATREVFQQELKAVVRHLISMRLNNPEMSAIMRRERLDGLPHARKVYEEIMAPIGDDLFSFVLTAQERGIVRKDLNGRAYFIALLESVFGYMDFEECKLKLWKDAYRFPKDMEAYIEFIVRLYTEGVFQ